MQLRASDWLNETIDLPTFCGLIFTIFDKSCFYLCEDFKNWGWKLFNVQEYVYWDGGEKLQETWSKVGHAAREFAILFSLKHHLGFSNNGWSTVQNTPPSNVECLGSSSDIDSVVNV